MTKSGSPERIRISLNTFADYLSATPSQRIDCVRRQRAAYGQPFVPGANFYADLVRAIQQGRRSGNDAMNVRAATARQQPTRRLHYSNLAENWLEWLEDQGRPESVAVGRTTWSLDSLEVGISPQLALRGQDGSVQVLTLWLKTSELSNDAAGAALRLLGRHMDDLLPGGTAAVLDVRRKQLHLPPKRRLRRDYDAWLEAEAVGLAHLWQTMDRQSA